MEKSFDQWLWEMDAEAYFRHKEILETKVNEHTSYRFIEFLKEQMARIEARWPNVKFQ